MVFCALILRPRVNRIANIALSTMYAATIIAGTIGEWNYFILGSAIEVALLAALVYYAWTWPKRHHEPPRPDERPLSPRPAHHSVTNHDPRLLQQEHTAATTASDGTSESRGRDLAPPQRARRSNEPAGRHARGGMLLRDVRRRIGLPTSYVRLHRICDPHSLGVEVNVSGRIRRLISGIATATAITVRLTTDAYLSTRRSACA